MHNEVKVVEEDPLSVVVTFDMRWSGALFPELFDDSIDDRSYEATGL